MRARSASRQALELHALVLQHMKRAGPGFESGVPPSLPLQSNPHMHLFEAALAGCEMCSESSLWKPLADELAELALDAASSTRRPVRCANSSTRTGIRPPDVQGRIVEPGHQFEWAWLLLRWGSVRRITRTCARRRAQAHRRR